ncbi:ATP-binding protein [uncultured Maricaulis sp.]|uniref:sensor histidine kinase n=1 Tax=uncultured Maricaulis sp. TaxID=174710 RepID=UPI0030D71311|tara:strand:+ start:19663 stop:21993 length:2331 start_codon:yes stop_codon:yes gene_type:complete
MKTTAAGEPSSGSTRSSASDGVTAWQRAIEADGWPSLVLPGILALTFILIVFLAVMAGDRALVASARETNAATLHSVLAGTMQRFEDWAQHQERNAQVWADNDLVRDSLEDLLQAPMGASITAVPAQAQLRATLGPWLTEYGYRGFFLLGENGRVVASLRNADLGHASPILSLVDRDQLRQSRGVLTRPQIVNLAAGEGAVDWPELEEEVAMYAIAPIMSDTGVRGYFALRIDPFAEYSAIFSIGRAGRSGGTFAVDRDGLLLTEARYADTFRAAGLLAEGHPSMLHVEVRDPGTNLTDGAVPSMPYAQWPLTEAAQMVSNGPRGANMTGYRDFRGVLVMGNWAWNAQREIGIITEVEVGEALAGVNRARAVLRVFAVAMALCFITIAVLFNAHRTLSRRRARETLEATLRFRQILMTAAEGIFGFDGNGIVTFINPRACEMLGYGEDELIGKPLHPIIHHSRRDGSPCPGDECPIFSSVATPPDGVEDIFWTKAGECIPIEFSKSPVNAADPVAGIVVTFRDITKRKRDDLALLRHAQELKRSNAELQEFAYAASHDLQEPLRKIQAFGERLNKKYHANLDETGQHYLDRMVDASTRMRRLIDDLLSYSRVNSKTTRFQPVDLSGVLADVLSDLEPRIAAEGAKLKVGILPAVEADSGQMHQLFLNLLTNSIKFHRVGIAPSIMIEGSVEVGDAGAVARIAVTDNGIGFEARHADRIFGMFERLHGREEYDGTGVGLATCRKIVEHHSGTLTAWGEPDAGAVFTIVLPIRQTVDA